MRRPLLCRRLLCAASVIACPTMANATRVASAVISAACAERAFATSTAFAAFGAGSAGSAGSTPRMSRLRASEHGGRQQLGRQQLVRTARGRSHQLSEHRLAVEHQAERGSVVRIARCGAPTPPGVAGVLTDRTPTALPVVGARAHGEGGWTAAAALVSSAMAANPTCSLSWGSLELN